MLALNYVVVLLPSSLILAVLELNDHGSLLQALSALSAVQWAYFLIFALGVYVWANFAQQVAIRKLGPTLVATIMPVRLLSSVAGSYAVLNEEVASVMEGCGLFIVAGTAVAYLGYRGFKGEGKQPSKSNARSGAVVIEEDEPSTEMKVMQQPARVGSSGSRCTTASHHASNVQ